MDTSLVSSRLLPGERILWSGQPQQGILFTSQDVFLIPFSLLWGGFAVFWESSVLRAGTPGFFALWGIPFVAAGLYLIAGRFLVDAWVRRGLVYAVTNGRILIAGSQPYSKFIALNLDQLPTAELKERQNGRGDIVFGDSSVVYARRGFGAWSPAATAFPPRFLGIEDVNRVFDLIQRQSQAKAA